MLFCGVLWCSVVSRGICGDLVLRGVLWCAVLCSVLSFSVVSGVTLFCSVLSHGVPWQLLFSSAGGSGVLLSDPGCLNLIKQLWGEGKEKKNKVA